MATSGHVPHELDWHWRDDGRTALVRRFREELVNYLKALSAWSPPPDEAAVGALADVAERFAEAAGELDICAANCHAMAATLRAHSSGDGFSEASSEGAIRLRTALGKNVMLTHTTIEQLIGKHVRLEYLDGPNAIVQVDGEYWGTPLDRVLVVPMAGDTSTEDPLPAEEPPDGSPRPAFQFDLHSGELSNVIQFLTMTSRNGTLVVRFREPLGVGKLLFEDRRVTGAMFGEHQGIEAVARMMNQDGAVATFTDGLRVNGTQPTLRLSTEQLLIEAAVKADELNYETARSSDATPPQPAIQ